MMARNWPRLSETLTNELRPDRCQSCGYVADIGIWQEHDVWDQPEPIFVPLCRECSDKLIELHPRLYEQLANNVPLPGIMAVCAECKFRQGLRCTHPDLKANGGPGLPLLYTQPHKAFIDGRKSNGRRFGRLITIYPSRPSCDGRMEIAPYGMEAKR